MQIPPGVEPSPGEILDLSLEGCRIEFVAPQRLVVDQRVELLFCINNLPFHVLAVVKSCRSFREFGFSFPGMLDRARVQLEELMDELKHPLPKRGQVIPIRAYRLR